MIAAEVLVRFDNGIEQIILIREGAPITFPSGGQIIQIRYLSAPR